MNGTATIGKVPSLYTDDETVDTGVTILQGLEPSPGKRQGRKKGMLVAVLLMAAVPALYFSTTRPVMQVRAEAPSASPFPVSKEATVVAANEPSQRAAIITEPEPVDSATKGNTVMPESRAIASEAVLKESSPKTPPAKTIPNQPHRKNAPSSKSHDKTNVKSVVASADKSPSQAKGQKDRDVDLVAALLAYSGKPGQGQATPHAGRDIAADHSSSMKANRDIVTRVAGESTASLVQRCRALGWLEGELCRVRVCSGLWGKDAACPSNSGTQSAYN